MANKKNAAQGRRTYISQADIPGLPLEKALKVATAIGENYGYKPSSPLSVAKALDLSPTTGGFPRALTTSVALPFAVFEGWALPVKPPNSPKSPQPPHPKPDINSAPMSHLPSPACYSESR